MTKPKYWLSILAISVVLIAGSLAVSPIAIAGDDNDDDDDGGTQQCVDDCIEVFEDAIEECNDLPSEDFAFCVLIAHRVLEACLFGGEIVDGGKGELSLAEAPKSVGCISGPFKLPDPK